MYMAMPPVCIIYAGIVGILMTLNYCCLRVGFCYRICATHRWTKDPPVTTAGTLRSTCAESQLTRGTLDLRSFL